MSVKSRSKRDVETALRSKGFEQRATDHNYFEYYTLTGQRTKIKTKTSFGHKPKNIEGDLIRSMARQCALTVPQFVQLVDCPLTRDEYEAILRAKDIIG